LNRHTPALLSTVTLSLSDELTTALQDRSKVVLFTWNPASQVYRGKVSEPPPGE